MKMYALRHREWAHPGSSNATVVTKYARRVRGTQGMKTNLVSKLEEATLWPTKARAEQVKRYSKIPLTVILVDVVIKEIEE